ncbi:MAG: hypothetical protein AAF702_50030 [Chloroflexota bacterium]
MREQHNDLIRRWINLLHAEPIDLERVKQIAEQLGKLHTAEQVRKWMTALHLSIDDSLDCTTCQRLLPEFVHAQLNARLQDESRATLGADRIVMDEIDADKISDVKTHLMLCPQCAIAYANIVELTQLSLADTIPVTGCYPQFDLSFLGETTSSSNAEATLIQSEPLKIASLIEEAVNAGREWIEDTLGGITIVFGSGLQTQAAGGWAMKSRALGAPLAQVLLENGEVEGWEIEVSAFADPEDESLCYIEISLYSLERANNDGSGIPIVLGYGDNEIHQETDEGGIAEFESIPREELGHLGVHVKLL